MEKNKEYIRPTKERPVYKAYCTDFGFIEQDFYKRWEVRNELNWCVGSTFALNLTDAIIRLHNFIKSYRAHSSGTKYELYLMDGTFDKNGNVKETKVYSISERNAKNWQLKQTTNQKETDY